jgi:hypothetical protein
MGETTFCDGTCQVARTVDVRASQLRKGDWLIGSGRLVTHNPSRGARTPSGKIDVGIDGYLRTWGASTTIRVRRHA